MTSPPLDVITAKKMSQPSKKQSHRTLITSHFGGEQNKRSRMKERKKKKSNMIQQWFPVFSVITLPSHIDYTRTKHVLRHGGILLCGPEHAVY